ncbi:SRPBCC family protein [Arsenicicoccus piscis]|uniref:Polyketide cyclase n=1 Tax=Arsenicicoccus piscis TaxID=673954 RepID=A0ABQ6HMJ3_9MICO|nr:SRPBCC family protein [Arsenicicoccus piscis]MCH8628707.1 SRPBCC family protein [Arsenicicoccus piscis]GMA19355.1 polyketide cyclase [Arsenicicoccus piscis]
MSDESKKITVSRTIDASAKDLWDVLSNPARHVELDGSGFIQSDHKTDRITANGQVFTMNMSGAHMGGDYQTDNHVVGYDKDRLLAWKTAPAGTEPPGWQWVWELQADGPDQTTVTLTYDWSGVTDKALLQKVGFPLVSKDQLEDSLNKLAAAVSGS